MMMHLQKQEIPHRDEDGSAMVEVVEDLVTSQSRDVQVTLGGWLNDERRMRQDVMTSQGLQQQALVDAARAAGQHLSALMVRRHSLPVVIITENYRNLNYRKLTAAQTLTCFITARRMHSAYLLSKDGCPSVTRRYCV